MRVAIKKSKHEIKVYYNTYIYQDPSIYFTDLDKVVSLCFEFEYIESKSKSTHNLIHNGPYVLQVSEDTVHFGQNVRNTMKKIAADIYLDKIKTKDKIDKGIK